MDLDTAPAVPADHRTRTFTWSDPAALPEAGRELAGIDLLRGVMEGRLPKPPIADLVDAEIVAVSAGEVTFALAPAEWMYNPLGSVHGGIFATLLDSCMGCAIHSLLPAGGNYTTTDLHIRYVRPLTEATGRVLATGTVLHPGRRVMTAEGRLIAENGEKLIASGDTACIILG